MSIGYFFAIFPEYLHEIGMCRFMKAGKAAIRKWLPIESYIEIEIESIKYSF